MKTYIKYAFATLTASLALSAASLAQSNPPAWSPTTSYKVGDVVTYEGVEFKCLNNENLLHPTPHSTYWDIAFVYSGPLVIPVGPNETMTTLTAAWNYIAYASIANNSSIELKLDSNYHETFTSSFSLDHPYGSKISIVGQNNGDSAYFGGGGAGFTLDSHHTIADLEGLTITAPGNGSGKQPGIGVTQRACLAKLQNITIQNFDIAVSADTGGIIDNVATLVPTGFSVGGIYAGNSALINIPSMITVDGGSSNPKPPQYAFYANAGTINCPASTGVYCLTNFWASTGGRIDAINTSSGGNPSLKGCISYFATEHSYINASGSNMAADDIGYSATTSSFIDASGTNSMADVFDYSAKLGGIVDASFYLYDNRVDIGTNDGSYIYDPM